MAIWLWNLSIELYISKGFKIYPADWYNSGLKETEGPMVFEPNTSNKFSFQKKCNIVSKFVRQYTTMYDSNDILINSQKIERQESMESRNRKRQEANSKVKTNS